MTLAYDSILFERSKGNIFISPFNPEQLGASSYDVRLGNWFCPLIGYHQVVIPDPSGKLNVLRRHVPVYGDFFYLNDGEEVEIPRNGVLLAMTKERIGSKNNITPIIRTRSSIARAGIFSCQCAGFGDIGYYDQHWTVEFTSHIPEQSLFGAHLTVGQRFAQVSFEMDTNISVSSLQYTGQYSVDDWPLCMLPKEKRGYYEVVKENGVVYSVKRR